MADGKCLTVGFPTARVRSYSARAHNIHASRIPVVRGGTIGAFAGAGHAQGDGGQASAATLFFPQRVAWDSTGSLYIADASNNRVRKVTPDNKITTVAGSGSSFLSGDGGPATSAGVVLPRAVAVDGLGNLFIATLNQIRKVDTTGTISTVVNKSNTAGFNGDGAAAPDAQLFFPAGLALDPPAAGCTGRRLIYKETSGRVSIRGAPSRLSPLTQLRNWTSL